MPNDRYDENVRHPRTDIPSGIYINVQMWYSKEANVGGGIEHTRITQHMRESESIFSTCGKRLTIRNVWGFRNSKKDSYGTSNTRLKAENIDLSKVLENSDVLKVYNEYKKDFPEINVLVCFVEGNFFMRDGEITGVIGTTRRINGDEKNYLILLSEVADPILLAHELGHVFNLSNKNGAINDPDPFPGDCQHNKNIDNLMYPQPQSTNITAVQCEFFFNSKIMIQN